MSEIYATITLVDKVCLNPESLHKGVNKIIKRQLKAEYEGKCSYHGYIKIGSINILQKSPGLINDCSLNGNVIYHVQYNASICNPAIGSIISVKVVNSNMFGILAEIVDSKKNVIIEAIVAKDPTNAVKLEKINLGDVVDIEIKGKKFELGDKKVTVLGTLVETRSKRLILDKDLFNKLAEEYSDEDELEELEDDDDEEGEGQDVDVEVLLDELEIVGDDAASDEDEDDIDDVSEPDEVDDDNDDGDDD